MKCTIKRPTGINVNYLTLEGDEITQTLREFKARMFLHEMDHLDGRTMTHWRLCEGLIEIEKGKEENH